MINLQKPKIEEEGNMADMDHLRKLFIGGLSAITTEDSLRGFYSQWGDVVDCIVMRDPATKRSRGFGFITYSDISMVDKAQAERPHNIDGKTVESKRALPRPELGKNDLSVKKIFVGGLKENHDEQSLTDHFTQFGKVISVKILTDKITGRKRGFAFVEFDDYDAVDKAVLYKNHTIKYVLVDVKKSAYKQELARKLATQQPGGMVVPQGNISAGGSGGGYQQSAAVYNPHAYAYPPQVPQSANAYNGWGGYAQPAAPGYHQPPPAAPASAYGAYGTPPQNGMAAWNTAAYSAASTWGHGYGAAAAAPVAAAQTSTNGWNGGAAPNFGDYQQAYNGGPQKAGNLQGNRMNPYSVSAAPNYGSTSTGYINMYGSGHAVGIPTATSSTLSKSSSIYQAAHNGSAPPKKIRRPY